MMQIARLRQSIWISEERTYVKEVGNIGIDPLKALRKNAGYYSEFPQVDQTVRNRSSKMRLAKTQRHNDSGIVPVNLLKSKSKNIIAFMLLAKSSSMVPFSLLSPTTEKYWRGEDFVPKGKRYCEEVAISGK